MLSIQLVEDLVFESELIHAVLKAFFLEVVADTNSTIALDCQISLLREVKNLLHSKDLVLAQQVELDLLGFLLRRLDFLLRAACFLNSTTQNRT